jgi:hypothetical protein
MEVLGALATDAGRPVEGLRLIIAADPLHQDTQQHCHHRATAAADRELATDALGNRDGEVIRLLAKVCPTPTSPPASSSPARL